MYMCMAMGTLHVTHFSHKLNGFEILIPHIGQSNKENETRNPKVSPYARGSCRAKTEGALET